MKILIIGGTGAISTAFTHACKNKGWDVWIINRGSHMERLPNKICITLANINNTEKIEIADDYDCIIDFTIWNSGHAKRAIKLFENKTKQFIFLNSTCIYKHSLLNEKITEESPIEENPIWKYQKDKFEARKILLKSKLPFVEVRPGHTYDYFTIPTNIMGIGYGLVERIKKNKPIIVHDDGNSLWTLTHSTDVAIGLIGLVGNEKTIGESFHITYEKALSWKNIFNIYGEILKKEVKMEFIPSIRICQMHPDLGESLIAHRSLSKIFDNSKIKKFVPHYDPLVSAYEGIKHSINWHEKNKDKIFYKKEMNKVIDDIINKNKKYIGGKLL